MRDGKLGFGIIGCGVIAPFHVKSIEKCEDAELVAVCDIDEQKGRKFAHEQGEVAFYKDFRELLVCRDVDVVCICTPSGMHADMGCAAAEAGKHLLCEKPLDISLAKIDGLIESCDKNKVKLGCIFQRRTYGSYKKTRKVVQDGLLGQMVLGDAYLKYYRSQEYYNSGQWRGTWELDGGGCLMNQGVHGIDILLWIMGEVKSVYAKCTHLVRDIPVEDTAVALLHFKNGVYGVIEGTTSVNPGQSTRIELHGKRGTITIHNDKITQWATTTDEDEIAEPKQIHSEEKHAGGTSDPTAIGMEGHIELIADMAAAVLNDREPMINGESARRPVELILSIYESQSKGKEIVL